MELFNDNLVYGDKNISPVRISKAIKIAEIDEFIGSLSNGLNTHIGERGIKLSKWTTPENMYCTELLIKDFKINKFNF